MNKSKQFDALLKRFLAGKVSEIERAEIEKWLDEYPATDYFRNLPDEEQQALLLRTDAGVYAAIRRSKQAFFTTTWFRAAAAVVLLMAASLGIWQWRHIDTIQITASAQVAKTILPDGSILWLKPHSTVSYPEKFTGDTRVISFVGEALFEIEKDPFHPFVIQCGSLAATVLGTSFHLSTIDSGYLSLTVLTGKVSLSSSRVDTSPQAVLADRSVIYNGKELITETSVGDVQRAILVADTEYDMRFADVRMREITHRIEEKFGVKVLLSDERINSCLVTADFTDQSLSVTLTRLSEILGFEYTINDQTVTLTGKGCPQ